ncbi:MAG: DNA gyrase inhibitor YacG [Aquincola sp.]|nr:DNA gyrase inhibitor YacG [Aquincola sp.]MDH4289261.1 DNA gyrase inhibitor YacG [Aquincola sp.]MDH5331793.1 DNA gyrase inhibitor YacG [Aquincola sp.]
MSTQVVVARTVRCPGCGGPSLYGAANRWRPFCNERCRHVDLGAWASEAYRVPDPASGVDARGQLGDEPRR